MVIAEWAVAMWIAQDYREVIVHRLTTLCFRKMFSGLQIDFGGFQEDFANKLQKHTFVKHIKTNLFMGLEAEIIMFLVFFLFFRKIPFG